VSCRFPNSITTTCCRLRGSYRETCAMDFVHKAAFLLPIRSTRSSPIKRSWTCLPRSAGVVAVVSLLHVLMLVYNVIYTEQFLISKYFRYAVHPLKSRNCVMGGNISVLRYFGRYPAMGSARYRWGAWR